jgi:hypothetical protein
MLKVRWAERVQQGSMLTYVDVCADGGALTYADVCRYGGRSASNKAAWVFLEYMLTYFDVC